MAYDLQAVLDAATAAIDKALAADAVTDAAAFAAKDAEIAALKKRVAELEDGPVDPPVDPPPPPPPPPPPSDWPNASNTGVPAGTALTVLTRSNLPAGVTMNSGGDIGVDKSGVTLSGFDIRGAVYINANNVTLKNSKVLAGAWVGVRIAEGVTGAVVDHCTIDGRGGPTQGIWGSGKFTANNIFNCENGLAIEGSGSVIQDNFIHDLKASGSPHYDGIQIDGGNSNITIRHNTIHNQYNQTSAVMIDNSAGPISNITVDDNLLVGGGYVIYVDGHFNSNPITGVSITNNHMGANPGGGTTNFNRTSPVYTGNVNDGLALLAQITG